MLNMMGRNTAQTTYGDNGATTYSRGMSFPSGNNDLLNFFKELARRQLMRRPGMPGVGGSGIGLPVQHTPIQHAPQMQERPGPQIGRQAAPDDVGLIGSLKSIGGSPGFYAPDQHGNVFMGYGRGTAPSPQGASFQGTYGPGAQSTPGLNTGYGTTEPGAPAIDDQSWRIQQFRSQFPDQWAAAVAAAQRG